MRSVSNDDGASGASLAETDPGAHPGRAVAASTFSSQVLKSTAANVLLLVFGTATGLLAARLLGPRGRGQLAAVMNWQILAGGVAALGLPDAIVYFTARSPREAARHLGTAMVLVLGVSVPVTAAVWFALPVLLSAQPAAVVALARLYALSIPIEALWALPDRTLRGQRDFVRWNALRLVPPAMYLGALVTATLTGRDSVRWVVLAYLVCRSLSLPAVLVWVQRRSGGRLQVERRLARPMVRYGIPSMLSVLPSSLNFNLDQLVMAGFLPDRTLGLYVIGVTWSNMTNPLALAFSSVLFPRIASDHNTHSRVRNYAQGSRIGLLCSIVLSAVFLPLTPFVLPLFFGSSFRPAVPAALVLVGSSVFTGWNYVLEEGLRGLGRPSSVLWSEAAGLVATVVALTFLLAPFDLMGAALASVAGYATVTANLLVHARRCTGLTLNEMARPKIDDVSLVVTTARRRLRSGRS